MQNSRPRLRLYALCFKQGPHRGKGTEEPPERIPIHVSEFIQDLFDEFVGVHKCVVKREKIYIQKKIYPYTYLILTVVSCIHV